MVSGFLTSPCDHARMSSAVARPMRSSSKTLTSSKVSYFLRVPATRRSCRRCWRPLRVVGPAPAASVAGGRAGARQISSTLLASGRRDRSMPSSSAARYTSSSVSRISIEAPSRGQHLDVQAQRLHLLDEHLERLRDARLGDVLALDDGLVDLHAAGHVVGLDGEQLLQRVGRAVRLERPDLHLAEPLATELRLTTQRLLRDHRVRAGRAGVDLVVDQVVELQDVHVADGDRLGERLAGAAVEQPRLAGARRPGGRRPGWGGSSRAAR